MLRGIRYPGTRYRVRACRCWGFLLLVRDGGGGGGGGGGRASSGRLHVLARVGEWPRGLHRGASHGVTPPVAAHADSLRVPPLQPDAAWDAIHAAVKARTVAGMPPAGELVRLRWPDCPLDTLVAGLARDGAVIVEAAVTAAACAAVEREMDPHIQAVVAEGPNRSRRPGCVLARSPASWELAEHPLVLQACEGVLGRQVLTKPNSDAVAAQMFPDRGFRRHPWQLDLTQIILIEPGGTSRRRDCQFDDTPFLSVLKHLINVEGGAAE